MARQAAEYGLEFAEPPVPRVARNTAARRNARVIELDWQDPPPADAVYVAPDSHRPHGSYTKYVVERCKCPPCRAGKREYEQRRLRAMSRPDEVWAPYVSAGRARAHLQQLRTAGIGFHRVADLAGLSRSAVGKILYPSRYRGMSTSKRIRAETERKILAVRLEDAARLQEGLVPAEPTRALLEDLVSRGFTKVWIAEQLGTTRSLQIGRGGAASVQASRARAVRELYRRLDGVEAPPRRCRWDRSA